MPNILIRNSVHTLLF